MPDGLRRVLLPNELTDPHPLWEALITLSGHGCREWDSSPADMMLLEQYPKNSVENSGIQRNHGQPEVAPHSTLGPQASGWVAVNLHQSDPIRIPYDEPPGEADRVP